MRLGVPELLIILFIILLIFGAGRLPAIGRALGQGARAFRKVVRGSPKRPRRRKRPKAPP